VITARRRERPSPGRPRSVDPSANLASGCSQGDLDEKAIPVDGAFASDGISDVTAVHVDARGVRLP
jgi:hypothetical protein